MKFVKQSLARTVALVRRLLGTGVLSVVAGKVTQEEPVITPVSGALPEFAMRDVARISVMMILDAFVQLDTPGRDVSKVRFKLWQKINLKVLFHV